MGIISGRETIIASISGRETIKLSSIFDREAIRASIRHFSVTADLRICKVKHTLDLHI